MQPLRKTFAATMRGRVSSLAAQASRLRKWIPSSARIMALGSFARMRKDASAPLPPVPRTYHQRACQVFLSSCHRWSSQLSAPSASREGCDAPPQDDGMHFACSSCVFATFFHEPKTVNLRPGSGASQRYTEMPCCPLARSRTIKLPVCPFALKLAFFLRPDGREGVVGLRWRSM